MTSIEVQIEQMRDNLKGLQSGKFHYVDAAGNPDQQMQADQIAKISFVLSAYDDFVRRQVRHEQ